MKGLRVNREEGRTPRYFAEKYFPYPDGEQIAKEMAEHAPWHAGVRVNLGNPKPRWLVSMPVPVGEDPAPAEQWLRDYLSSSPVSSGSAALSLGEPSEVVSRSSGTVSRKASAPTEAGTPEADLETEFVAFTGRKYQRVPHTVGRSNREADLYDEERGHLIEVEGANSSAKVYEAVGQVIVYGGALNALGKPVTFRAVLFPERLWEQDEKSLKDAGIFCIWRNDDGTFSDNAGGLFLS